MQPGRILADEFPTLLPGFSRLEWKRRGYYFRRGPIGSFYDAFVVVLSTRLKVFEVDVYSGIHPVWDLQFGRHHLRSSTGLSNLRLGSKMIDMRQVAYHFEDSDLGIRRCVSRIADDARRFALPWFEERHSLPKRSPLLAFGLKWIDEHLAAISPTADEDMWKAYQAAGHVAWDVKDPLLNLLLHDLRAFASREKVDRADRNDIQALAQDLIVLAARRRRGEPGATDNPDDAQ